MRYFIAYETDSRPFLLFDLVADSLTELQDLGLEGDPLVVTEDQLMNPADPNYISYEHGICHKRLFNGAIEDRPAGEITAQETALNKAIEVAKTKTVEAELDTSTFTYDAKEFPMTPSARSVYTAVIDDNPVTVDLITTTGTYALKQADIAAFKAKYYEALFNANSSATAV